MHSENDRKKAYLRSYIYLKRKEQHIAEEIEAVRTRYIGHAITYSDMPKAHDSEHDLSDYIVEVDALLRTLQKRQAEAAVAYRQIEAAVERMEDPKEKELLRLRYLQDLSWQEVADRMVYEISWVTRIHGKALEHFVI